MKVSKIVYTHILNRFGIFIIVYCSFVVYESSRMYDLYTEWCTVWGAPTLYYKYNGDDIPV